MLCQVPKYSKVFSWEVTSVWKLHNKKISSMSRYAQFVFREFTVWASTPFYVNKSEYWYILQWSCLQSADVQGFFGKKYLHITAWHTFWLLCEAMKCIWSVMCLLCFRVRIQHFTAHKISDLVLYSYCRGFFSDMKSWMYLLSRNSWNFSVIATYHEYLCVVWLMDIVAV